MLEGINYYPRNKKRNSKKLWLAWFVVLVIIIVGFYWYLNVSKNNHQVEKKPVVILISKGENELDETSKNIINNTMMKKKIPIDSKLKVNKVNTKELDEVIQNYIDK